MSEVGLVSLKFSKQFNTARQNRSFKEAIENYFDHDSSVLNKTTRFACECSIPDCKHYIKISAYEYENYHNTQGAYVIVNDHYDPATERIIADRENFLIVEKITS